MLDPEPKLDILDVRAEQDAQAADQVLDDVLAQLESFDGIRLPMGPLLALEALLCPPGDGLEVVVETVERVVDGDRSGPCQGPQPGIIGDMYRLNRRRDSVAGLFMAYKPPRSSTKAMTSS